jgi:transposase
MRGCMVNWPYGIDMTTVKAWSSSETLQNRPIWFNLVPPRNIWKHPQNMCIDKGHDYPEVDRLVEEWGYTGHVARRGVDQSKRERIPGYRTRRWIVERTHSWMNRFKRLLIRWRKERKEENYVTIRHFACKKIDNLEASWNVGLALKPDLQFC